jgi:myo-inositol 2-dehydrogenase/D-chiro-inositol 1-dehydrogenase
VKCFETIDATHRSVRRRRTIELHFEPMSERAIFKTQMTAIGCALLVATFLLTLVYLGIASLIPLPGYALIGLRALVFGPLVLFLLAQILLPLTRPSSAEKTSTR